MQGIDPNKEENQAHPDQRKEYLVQKIGSQAFTDKQKQIAEEEMNPANTQRSLDQYSALNPSEETALAQVGIA